MTRLEFYTPRNISGTAKARDFKFCIRVGHVMTDCLLNGHGQKRVNNFYILDLENFAIASRRCIGAINELVDGQLVDYTYDGRARHG